MIRHALVLAALALGACDKEPPAPVTSTESAAIAEAEADVAAAEAASR